jgi:hypothetical protein
MTMTLTMTAKYCPKCSERLSSIAPRTENEIQFYWASLRHGALSQEGPCDNCGREELLTYYRIPG